MGFIGTFSPGASVCSSLTFVPSSTVLTDILLWMDNNVEHCLKPDHYAFRIFCLFIVETDMGNTGGRERSQPPVDDSGPTVLQTRINYANRANDGDMSFRV